MSERMGVSITGRSGRWRNKSLRLAFLGQLARVARHNATVIYFDLNCDVTHGCHLAISNGISEQDFPERVSCLSFFCFANHDFFHRQHVEFILVAPRILFEQNKIDGRKIRDANVDSK